MGLLTCSVVAGQSLWTGTFVKATGRGGGGEEGGKMGGRGGEDNVLLLVIDRGRSNKAVYAATREGKMLNHTR